MIVVKLSVVYWHLVVHMDLVVDWHLVVDWSCVFSILLYTQLQGTTKLYVCAVFFWNEQDFSIEIHTYSGPIQWAHGGVGLKPSAAARPWTLADCEWRAAAPGLTPFRLPRALCDTIASCVT